MGVYKSYHSKNVLPLGLRCGEATVNRKGILEESVERDAESEEIERGRKLYTPHSSLFTKSCAVDHDVWANHFLEEPKDFACLGVTFGRFFRVNQLIVDDDFISAAFAGDQGQTVDDVLVTA